MLDIPEKHRHLPEAKRLEAAQNEFIAASEALLAANRAAQAAGKYMTDEMEETAKGLEVIEAKLKEAEAEFDLAVGEPKPVKVRGIVLKKLRETFATELQEEAIRTVATGLTYRLPVIDSAEGLERVRLAAIKVANGDLNELRRQIEIAKQDWRDVINEAEYPEAWTMGLLEYSKLGEEVRKQLEARDRGQYVAWLGKSDGSSFGNFISKLFGKRR